MHILKSSLLFFVVLSSAQAQFSGEYFLDIQNVQKNDLNKSAAQGNLFFRYQKESEQNRMELSFIGLMGSLQRLLSEIFRPLRI